MRDSASSEAISECSSDTSDSWERIGEKLEECLLPLKEDLAEWINRTFDMARVTAANLLDVLDSGVVVCQLAKLIHERSTAEGPRSVPPFDFKWWPNAQPASFFARDNAANFLAWCRQLGINEALLFESESLVLRTQPRTVVLCLLELARIASKYGIEPPGIVKLEREMDEKEDVDESSKPKAFVPDRSCDVSSSSSASGSTPLSEMDEASCKLHAKVLRIADAHCSRSHVRRISDGKYLIAGRLVFVRLLNERHVMVRVGGGWDTLEHFVSRRKRSSLRSDSTESSSADIHQHLVNACSSTSAAPSSPAPRLRLSSEDPRLPNDLLRRHWSDRKQRVLIRNGQGGDEHPGRIRPTRPALKLLTGKLPW